MKKITCGSLLLILLCMPSFLSAQERIRTTKKIFGQELTEHNQRSLDETGVIRCGSTEYEMMLQEMYPNRATNEEFENWLAPKVREARELMASGRGTQIDIPIVFHILTDGAGPENLSQAAIQAF